MKIKIIQAEFADEFEKKLQEFFNHTPEARATLIDIKYTNPFDGSGESPGLVQFNYYYSAMIIYK